MIEHFSITDDDLNRRPREGKTSIIYSELQNFEEQLSDHSLSLKYTVKGQEIYRTGGNSYTLGAGNILITPPKQKIEGSVKGAEIATGICLHFDKQLVDETFSSMGRNIDENNPGNDFSPEEFNPLHLHHSEHHFHRQLRLINSGKQIQN